MVSKLGQVISGASGIFLMCFLPKTGVLDLSLGEGDITIGYINSFWDFIRFILILFRQLKII